MFLSNHSAPEQSSKAVAELIIQRISTFKPTQSRKFVLCLPTGSTPLLVYSELARRCGKGEISFEHVITINLDEYVGLGPDHSQSYYHFMEENFFSKVDIPKTQTHLLSGQPLPNQTHQDTCLAYENSIKNLGGINLLFMGIGENGHIAFNEPCSSFKSRTRVIKLDEDTRNVNARFFEDKSQVPTHALSMGIGTILDAKEIIVLANGNKKSEAIKMALEGGINHLCPASILQSHENVMIFTDHEASQKLNENTKKYLTCQSLSPSPTENGKKNANNFGINGNSENHMKRPNALRESSFNISLSPLSPKEEEGEGEGEKKMFTWSRPSSPNKLAFINGNTKNDMIANQDDALLKRGDDANNPVNGKEGNQTLLSLNKLQINEKLDNEKDEGDKDLNSL